MENTLARPLNIPEKIYQIRYQMLILDYMINDVVFQRNQGYCNDHVVTDMRVKRTELANEFERLSTLYSQQRGEASSERPTLVPIEPSKRFVIPNVMGIMHFLYNITFELAQHKSASISQDDNAHFSGLRYTADLDSKLRQNLDFIINYNYNKAALPQRRAIIIIRDVIIEAIKNATYFPTETQTELIMRLQEFFDGVEKCDIEKVKTASGSLIANYGETLTSLYVDFKERDLVNKDDALFLTFVRREENSRVDCHQAQEKLESQNEFNIESLKNVSYVIGRIKELQQTNERVNLIINFFRRSGPVELLRGYLSQYINASAEAMEVLLDKRLRTIAEKLQDKFAGILKALDALQRHIDTYQELTNGLKIVKDNGLPDKPTPEDNSNMQKKIKSFEEKIKECEKDVLIAQNTLGNLLSEKINIGSNDEIAIWEAQESFLLRGHNINNTVKPFKKQATGVTEASSSMLPSKKYVIPEMTEQELKAAPFPRSFFNDQRFTNAINWVVELDKPWAGERGNEAKLKLIEHVKALRSLLDEVNTMHALYERKVVKQHNETQGKLSQLDNVIQRGNVLPYDDGMANRFIREFTAQRNVYNFSHLELLQRSLKDFLYYIDAIYDPKTAKTDNTALLKIHTEGWTKEFNRLKRVFATVFSIEDKTILYRDVLHKATQTDPKITRQADIPFRLKSLPSLDTISSRITTDQGGTIISPDNEANINDNLANHSHQHSSGELNQMTRMASAADNATNDNITLKDNTLLLRAHGAVYQKTPYKDEIMDDREFSVINPLDPKRASGLPQSGTQVENVNFLIGKVIIPTKYQAKDSNDPGKSSEKKPDIVPTVSEDDNIDSPRPSTDYYKNVFVDKQLVKDITTVLQMIADTYLQEPLVHPSDRDAKLREEKEKKEKGIVDKPKNPQEAVEDFFNKMIKTREYTKFEHTTGSFDKRQQSNALDHSHGTTLRQILDDLLLKQLDTIRIHLRSSYTIPTSSLLRTLKGKGKMSGGGFNFGAQGGGSLGGMPGYLMPGGSLTANFNKSSHYSTSENRQESIDPLPYVIVPCHHMDEINKFYPGLWSLLVKNSEKREHHLDPELSLNVSDALITQLSARFDENDPKFSTLMKETKKNGSMTVKNLRSVQQYTTDLGLKNAIDVLILETSYGIKFPTSCLVLTEKAWENAVNGVIEPNVLKVLGDAKIDNVIKLFVDAVSTMSGYGANIEKETRVARTQLILYCSHIVTLFVNILREGREKYKHVPVKENVVRYVLENIEKIKIVDGNPLKDLSTESLKSLIMHRVLRREIKVTQHERRITETRAVHPYDNHRDVILGSCSKDDDPNDPKQNRQLTPVDIAAINPNFGDVILYADRRNIPNFCWYKVSERALFWYSILMFGGPEEIKMFLTKSAVATLGVEITGIVPPFLIKDKYPLALENKETIEKTIESWQQFISELLIPETTPSPELCMEILNKRVRNSTEDLHKCVKDGFAPVIPCLVRKNYFCGWEEMPKKYLLDPTDKSQLTTITLPTSTRSRITNILRNVGRESLTIPQRIRSRSRSRSRCRSGKTTNRSLTSSCLGIPAEVELSKATTKKSRHSKQHTVSSSVASSTLQLMSGQTKEEETGLLQSTSVALSTTETSINKSHKSSIRRAIRNKTLIFKEDNDGMTGRRSSTSTVAAANIKKNDNLWLNMYTGGPF